LALESSSFPPSPATIQAQGGNKGKEEDTMHTQSLPSTVDQDSFSALAGIGGPSGQRRSGGLRRVMGAFATSDPAVRSGDVVQLRAV